MLRRMTVSILQQRQQYRNQRLLLPISTTTKDTPRTSSSSSVVSLPRWKHPVVTSHGDYTQEAWLESAIGGPLYQHQVSGDLPRLPVNPLDDTLERFLPTALPLAQNAEEERALIQAARDFPQQAAPLQQRLLQRAQDWHNSSWLQHWWNTLGYLQVRDSVVVNVSYFFDFANDPGASTNITRGAALLHATAVFRNLLCSGTWPADAIGKANNKTPLCSAAYKYMFHASRIPQPHQDVVKIYDPSSHHHAIVSRKGQFYAMDLVCPTTHQPYSVDLLQDALRQIIDMADDDCNEGYPQLGWLTSSHRDDWTAARQVLLDGGGTKMAEALETLQSGAILLCLDDTTCVSKQESALLHWHGSDNSGSHDHSMSKNRWFDKSIQLNVTENGKAGLTGEHSLMDGMPMVTYADFITSKMGYDKCRTNPHAVHKGDCEPRRVFQDAFDNMSDASPVQSVVAKAKSDLNNLVSAHSLHLQSFHGYGSDFIKKAGFSPDAFVQMAMQVATFRLWDGQQGGTYEAAQVRPFLHGRTETARSVSVQSAAFCRAMGTRPLHNEDVEAVRRNKLQLLQDAVAAHVKYLGLAAKAQGVDRHFLGLSLLIENNEPTPDLLKDPVFVRSKRWRVSTSHLTHPKFENWGFGPVVDDGVGIAYSIHKRHCVFNVTARTEHQWSDKLCTLLEEALLEMRTLVELDQASKTTGIQSKL